jgi:hypothetical protein
MLIAEIHPTQSSDIDLGDLLPGECEDCVCGFSRTMNMSGVLLFGLSKSSAFRSYSSHSPAERCLAEPALSTSIVFQVDFIPLVTSIDS